jgi:hypothetical protein
MEESRQNVILIYEISVGGTKFLVDQGELLTKLSR